MKHDTLTETFINSVCERLAEHFLKPMAMLNVHTSFFTHAGIIAELFEWSCEFFEFYYTKLCNWATFATSEDNVFDAKNVEELILAFGHAKFLRLCMHHNDTDSYFIRKYEVSYLKQ